MYCHLLTSLKIVSRASFFPALLNLYLHENQQKRWIFIHLRFSDDLRGIKDHIQIKMMERCEWERNLHTGDLTPSQRLTGASTPILFRFSPNFAFSLKLLSSLF